MGFSFFRLKGEGLVREMETGYSRVSKALWCRLKGEGLVREMETQVGRLVGLCAFTRLKGEGLVRERETVHDFAISNRRQESKG